MINNKKKILWIGAFPPKGSDIYGGVLAACRSLLSSRFGSEFDFSLLDSTQKSNPPPRLLIRIFYSIPRAVKFFLSLLTFRPNAVLIFCGSGFGLAEKGLFAWFVRLVGIPCVMFPRGGKILRDSYHSLFWKYYAKIFFGGASVLLCQGTHWQSFAVDVLGFKKKDTVIINNWISNPKYFGIGKARKYFPPKSKLKILFVGWVEEGKGVFELIKACEILAKKHEFKLFVVGDGTSKPRLLEKVNRYKLNDTVVFVGWLKGNNLLDAYRQADIFVLPTYMEGMPNVLLEAMASGLPIVTTPVGNIPDIVDDGRTGIFVPVGDAAALSEALTSLILSESERARLGESGFKYAQHVFDLEVASKKMISVFRKLA